jgi:hypothetical protein
VLDDEERDHGADRLRGARQDCCPELTPPTEAGSLHRQGDRSPLRDVLDGNREHHEQAQPGPVRGIRGADRKALRKAVDEQDAEDEHGQPHVAASKLTDAHVALSEQGSGADEQENARSEPESDRCERALLERRLQEPEERGDRHRADADAEQEWSQTLGARAHEERQGRRRGPSRARSRSQRT